MKRIILGIIIALTLIGGTAAAYAHGGGNGGPGGPGRGVGGQVTAVSGSTITVSTHDGMATIVTTASTTFEVNGAAGSLTDITVGLYVRASGTRGTDGAFTATKVVASTTQPTPPVGGPGQGGPGRGFGGQVTAVSGSAITVSTREGTATITTTADTTFEVNGAAGSLTDITVGLYVRASGTRGTDGAFTATKVIASTTQPTPPARDGNGGPGRGPRPTATTTP